MTGWPTRAGQCLSAVALAVTCLGVSAWNTPCSGRKGGVSHCAGATFVCNDGSISASKKVCAVSSGGRDGMSIAPAPAPDEDCSCRQHKLCVGPRGGVFCYSDSGARSYKRE
jgi:hypothetical protein